MSKSTPILSYLIDQLDQHLRVINQAAHAPSPAAMEDVKREIGPRGLSLVEVWRLLWPPIEKNERWREVFLDRLTRREDWSVEPFRQMIGDILFADPSLIARITTLISLEEQAEGNNARPGNESTLVAPDEPTELAEEQTLIVSNAIISPNTGPWIQGFLLGGRFRLSRLLARGGFGEAWLAEDISGSSPVPCVVKKFSFQHSDANILADLRRRFEQEARTLERLGKDHDQIPSLYAFNTEGTEAYFVQEYVEGPNLAELVRDEGPMPEPKVLDFLDGVLGVLSYVHNNKVIHRDIKPANIILRKIDGKPVLIDFGALKEIATTVLDRFGHVTTTLPIGTPGFMPIEQVQGRPRLSTDIYALGFTTLYLLSGRLPADLTNIATGDVEWSDLDSMLSPQLKVILGTATAQMPDGRFNTARLMHDEILQLIDSQKPKPQIGANRWPRLGDIVEGNHNDLLRGKSFGLVIANNTLKMLAMEFGLNGGRAIAESETEYEIVFDDPSLGGRLIISTADDMREMKPTIEDIARRIIEKAVEAGKNRVVAVFLARKGSTWFPSLIESPLALPKVRSINSTVVFCSYDRKGNVRKQQTQGTLPTDVNEIQSNEVKDPDERRTREILDHWIAESEARLKSLIDENLPDERPSRYSLGSWSVGYLVMGGVRIPSLKELRILLERVQGHETGWPPWRVPTREELRPYVYNGTIECWLKETNFRNAAHSDFWRASNKGLMYLLRGYDEDSSLDRFEPGANLDLTLPIWRIGECLLHAGRFATELAGSAAPILFRASWKGLRGRTLVSRTSPILSVSTSRRSSQDSVTCELLLPADMVIDSLEWAVQTLTAPLYESFDFYSPPTSLVNKEVSRLKNSRV